MSFRACLLTLLFCAGCSGPGALRQPDFADEDDLNREGVMVAAGYTSATEDFDLPGFVGDDFDDSDGVNLRIAYRGSPYLVLEGVYEGAFEFEDSALLGGTDAEAHVGTINLRLYPLGFLEGNWGRVQPYGVGGFGGGYFAVDPSTAPDTSENSPVFRYGGGADVYLTNHIFGFGEYVFISPTADRAEDFEYSNFNVGLGVKF